MAIRAVPCFLSELCGLPRSQKSVRFQMHSPALTRIKIQNVEPLAYFFVKFDAYSCLRRLAWFVFQARCTSTAYQLVRERRPLPSCSSCVRHVYVLTAGCLAAGEDPKEPWSRFTAFWDDYPAKSFSRIRTSLSAFNTTPGTRKNAIRG